MKLAVTTKCNIFVGGNFDLQLITPSLRLTTSYHKKSPDFAFPYFQMKHCLTSYHITAQSMLIPTAK